MPFRIYLTKADRLPIHKPVPVDPPELVDRAALALELALLGGDASPADSSIWIPFNRTQEPGCRAIVMPEEGPVHHVEFALSFSHPQFERNLDDMFCVALGFATVWGGRVFLDDDPETELTRENLDVLLAPNGAFLTPLRDFWNKSRIAMVLEDLGFLEYPLGPVDEVSDYFRFVWHMPDGPPTLDDLLSDTPDHLSAHKQGSSAYLRDRTSGKGLVCIGPHPDAIVVKPLWTAAPFALQAKEVLRTVERVEARVGKPPLYYGSPATREERHELEQRAKGLGVSYYRWARDSGRTGGPVVKGAASAAAKSATNPVAKSAMAKSTANDARAKARAVIEASLAAARDNARKVPRATDVRLVLAKRHTFEDVLHCMSKFSCKRVEPADRERLTGEPISVTWRDDDDTFIRYGFDPELGLRTLHLEGRSAEILVNDIVNVAFMSVFESVADDLEASSEADVLFALAAVAFKGTMAIDERAAVLTARRNENPRIAKAADDAWKRASPPGTRGIVGVGMSAGWTTHPTTGAVRRVSSESDFRIEQATGLAVVASGAGATGNQGRPGAILSVWSLVGEVTAEAERRRAAEEVSSSSETSLAAGFGRAHEAVARTTWSWEGTLRPTVGAAALLLDGDHVWLGHVGTCRVSRLRRGVVVPITRDHSLGMVADAERASAPLAPPLQSVPTRALGQGDDPWQIRAERVRDGDWLFLANAAVHRALSDDQIGALLFPEDDLSVDPLSRADELLNRLLGSAESGSVAFALVGIRDRPERETSMGGSMTPPLSWLFQPGKPLPEPPPDWRRETGSRGPDARWFKEIAKLFDGVDLSASTR
jgi:serine/threonine protein phosphatase PrpC